ncbi:MAG: radical SAM protein [Firmicutes bacterium]|nr:radical SAM protein [Bacillota bacterium]
MAIFDTVPFNTTRVKKVAADLALDQALKYLSRDPEQNLPRILDFAERVAPEEGQKKNIRLLKARMVGDEKIMAQIKRLVKNPRMLKNFLSIWVVNAMLLGGPQRNALMKKLGIHIPSLILVDPTSACNLRCTGCWAGEYKQTDRLEPELLDRLFNEAKELGIYWIVFSGGEPFAYPELLDVVARHPDMGFMAYTNGTLITDQVADRLAELANFSPAFSLEGWREETDARRGEGVFDKVMAAMDRLRERSVYFGASVTVTRNNIETLFSDEYMDFLVDKGATYVWSFHYIPIGRGPNLDMMITPEQRAWLVKRVAEIRTTKPILVADFWNDGHFTGGCIAGGRMYFHINAAGMVEPCAFVHFATDNIRDKSLKEILASPLFAAYQKRQPFNQNHYAPCPIIDAPQALRDIVKETGAQPTHTGAEDVLTGIQAEFLDKRSREWLQLADQLEERYFGQTREQAGK